MAEWSQLPKDLLQLISERLDDNALDLLRFRSVCSTWRSSIPKRKTHHLPVKLPLLSISYDNNNDSSTWSLSKHTFFLITPPPPLQQQQQSLRPWLIEIGQNSHGQTRLWHPLLPDTPLPFHSPHVLDFNQHRVFDLGHTLALADYPPLHDSIYPLKVVVATWQGNKEEGFGSVLLSILDSRELALFRCDDERWTVIPDSPTPYDDVCVFKGRPCAVDGSGRTVMISPDSSVDLVAEPEPVFGGDQKYLVESEGELLLVDMYSEFVQEREVCDSDGKHSWWRDIVVRLDVFRLGEKEKKWVQLTTLGDRVLFLGDGRAFSATASDLCVVEGNCVIFKDDDLYGARVFHLDDGRFSFLSDDELFWPPPDWAPLHRQE